MSETLTIFGIDYPDTEGFKVKDDLGTTHTYGEGGGVTPTGTINIDDDGTYDVTNYATAEVAIDYVSKTYPITVVNHSSEPLTFVYPLNNNVVSSGYISTSSVAILANNTVTRRMPKGASLIGLRKALNAVYNFELRIDSTVVAPDAEYVKIYQRYKLYSISSNTFGEEGITLDVYDIADPWPVDIVAEPLSVTVNGTYTAPSGTAYTPVTVNVPSDAPNLQDKTVSYTPSETAQSQTVTADSGYDGLDEVSVSVGAISSTYVGTGIARKSSSDLTLSMNTVTAPAGYYESAASCTMARAVISEIGADVEPDTSTHTAAIIPYFDISSNGYIPIDEYTGTPLSVSASELVSGTLTISSSGTKDVTNYASASVAAGTEGTPSATKGTVSNHSVSVTPSVTNAAGYITGGTKTGTAVSVSASELVSGSETKTANGTYDVTNLASLVVAIPFSTITVSSSNPTGGSNGDVWIKTS